MQLKPGMRLKSTVCDTEVVCVKPPAGDVDLRCGGHAMVEPGSDAPAGLEIADGFSEGTQMGKRYADDEVGIEVLVAKPGAGSLSIGEAPLGLKDAKPLPASD